LANRIDPPGASRWRLLEVRIQGGGAESPA
jgi:hypothetical protein